LSAHGLLVLKLLFV